MTLYKLYHSKQIPPCDLFIKYILVTIPISTFRRFALICSDDFHAIFNHSSVKCLDYHLYVSKRTEWKNSEVLI